ncbi:MAG: outer membrane lipoprotein chaperone LolA [Candidatus Roizmanbacteria bacterium]|nr:outer membrane lipoprotein chaperone LolA [Candidatus Roizmanbacteria bacterium]
MKKILIVVPAILLACNVTFADGSEKILSKVQKKYETIKDVTAEFTQNITFGVSKMEQSFHGSLTMKKGNRYRVEMEQQTIVTDGKTVWSYSHPNNQVIIDKYKEDPKSFSPDRVLINVPKNYNTIFLGNENLFGKKTAVIKLTPKESKSLVKAMKVWINLEDYLMRKIEITDVIYKVKLYLINSIKLNTGVSDILFKFEIPEGTDTIDLR